MIQKRFEVDSCFLHLLAMGLMLCDHLQANFFPHLEWLKCIGRLAFPIFAFLVAEGFHYTHDRKKYRRRMLLFAVISEVPFNLFYANSYHFPFHQNVLWTFWMALLLMGMVEKAKAKGEPRPTFAASFGAVLLAVVVGRVWMADYFDVGILTVLLFYFVRGNSRKHRLLQLVGMAYLHGVMLTGCFYDVSLFGFAFEFPQQVFAVLSLIPIWLYRGKQGYHSKPFQYLCYGFYPLHLLLLYLLWS